MYKRYLFNIPLVMIFYALLMPGAAYAKPLTRIAIFPKENGKKLDLNLVKSLERRLNTYRKQPVEAVRQTTTYDEYRKRPEFIACKKDKDMNQTDSSSGCFNYYLIVSVHGKGGPVEATFKIYSKDEKDVGTYEVKTEEKIEYLSKSLMDKLITILFKNIRIVLMNFEERGGGEKNYSQLSQLLPGILAKGLNLSSRFILLDISNEKELTKKRKDGQNTRSSIHDRNTLLEKGKLLHANYIITGEFGELSGELWVSTQCLSIETGEIIVSLYKKIAPIDLDALEKNMAIVSAEMKKEIESDHQLREDRPKYVAISGSPPSPDTKENRETLLAIIDSISRKLNTLSFKNTVIKRDMDMVKGFVEKKHDKWMMSNALGADVLLLVELERKKRDRLNIDVKKFDVVNHTEEDSFEKKSKPEEIDRNINEIIEKIVKEKNWIESISFSNASTIETIEFSGPYKQKGVKIMGGISYRNDHELFLDTAGGVAIDIGYVIYPFNSSRWQFEIPRLTLDFLGSRAGGSQKVVGANLSGSVVYNFRPLNANNFYLGGSLGIYGVVRDSSDTNYDGRPGAGLIFGWQHTFMNARKVDLRLEFLRSFDEIPARTVGGDKFGGGRPGGFYLMVGTEFGD